MGEQGERAREQEQIIVILPVRLHWVHFRTTADQTSTTEQKSGFTELSAVLILQLVASAFHMMK